MGIVNQSQKSKHIHLFFMMSNQHYAAFIKLTKQDVVECKKMPKALAECFPMAKVASIATRGWTGKLKAKKRGNKVAMIVKPRKCLLPKMSKKRQSTDKIEGETKRSKSSVDFDDVAKVESTKVDQDKATKTKPMQLHRLFITKLTH